MEFQIKQNVTLGQPARMQYKFFYGCRLVAAVRSLAIMFALMSAYSVAFQLALVQISDSRSIDIDNRPNAFPRSGFATGELTHGMKMRRSFLDPSVFLLALVPTLVSSDATSAENATASDSRLRTWWHENGEINYETAVQEQNVRQSHVYSAWVTLNADSAEE